MLTFLLTCISCRFIFFSISIGTSMMESNTACDTVQLQHNFLQQLSYQIDRDKLYYSLQMVYPREKFVTWPLDNPPRTRARIIFLNSSSFRFDSEVLSLWFCLHPSIDYVLLVLVEAHISLSLLYGQ